MTAARDSSRGPTRVVAASREVEVRDAKDLPYTEFRREYVETNRPVVIRNSVLAWPAMRRWTPEYFKSRFGSLIVPVSHSQEMRFDEFIDAVLVSTNEEPGPYMYRLFLHQHLPDVLADLSPQNAYAFPRRHASPLMPRAWRRPDGYLKLLIGGIGGRFPVMHFDGQNAHAAITEIYGDKEFILFHPDDGPYLYPNPQIPNKSLVDEPLNQDRERFPLLSKATPYRTVLVPGDTVFVPSRWWHTARPLSVSISVCTNMLDGSNWAGYLREVTQDVPATDLKGRLKAAYLEGLGHFLSAMERAQERYPRATKALRVPGRIAPATSDVARDPSTMRLGLGGDTPDD